MFETILQDNKHDHVYNGDLLLKIIKLIQV